MAITTGLMSSLTDEWATPADLFEELNREFNFNLDVCADSWNHKCENYFSKSEDGLTQPWVGTCWMNPPYGREIGKWMKKALDSAWGGRQLFASYQPEQTQHGGTTTQQKEKSGFFVVESSLFPGMVRANKQRLSRPQLSFFGEV